MTDQTRTTALLCAARVAACHLTNDEADQLLNALAGGRASDEERREDARRRAAGVRWARQAR